MNRSKSQRPDLDWSIDVGLITEPLMLANFFKIMVGAALLTAALLAFLVTVTGDPPLVVPLLGVVGIALAVVVVLGFLVMIVVLRNRLSTRYVIDRRGVRQFSVDRRARAASVAAVVVGTLAASPGTVGAGLIAQSQANGSVAWSGIVSVRRYPSRRAIGLRNAWRTVMLIFCTPENYDAVATRIAAEMADHAGHRKPRRNPVPGLLAKTGLVILTCVPFFLLPYPFERDPFTPFLTLCFALAALWLVPMLGVVTLAGLAWLWIEIALRADGVLRLSRPEKWVPLALAAVASAVLVALIVGLMRGKVASALVGDEQDLEPDADDKDG